MTVQHLLDTVCNWAEQQADVRAVALVGSHARGNARADSDIDLVILSTNPTRYVTDHRWIETFGGVLQSEVEDWGNVQSVRVFYRSGFEVEFGFAAVDWASLPLEKGTREVLQRGAMILLDRDGSLARALEGLLRSW